jgi:hypothetical protein
MKFCNTISFAYYRTGDTRNAYEVLVSKPEKLVNFNAVSLGESINNTSSVQGLTSELTFLSLRHKFIFMYVICTVFQPSCCINNIICFKNELILAFIFFHITISSSRACLRLQWR